MRVTSDPERPPRWSKVVRWFTQQTGYNNYGTELTAEAINSDNAKFWAYEDALVRWGWRCGHRLERIHRKARVAPLVVPAPFLKAFREAMEKRNADS